MLFITKQSIATSLISRPARLQREAHTLASLCMTLILVVSPERIVLSGGVRADSCSSCGSLLLPATTGILFRSRSCPVPFAGRDCLILYYVGRQVLKREILYALVREKVIKLLGGYVQHPNVTPANIDAYITPSEWGHDAGIIGALTIAQVSCVEEGGRGARESTGCWCDDG